MDKLLFPVALAGLVACGGSVIREGAGASPTTGTGANTTTGTGADTTVGSGASTTTGSGASTGVGGGTSGGPCPLAVPPLGASCAGVPDQFRCTYGDSVRPDCRNVRICSGGGWTTANVGCAMPPPGACPASEPSPGMPCTGTVGQDFVCTYGDAICGCGCGGGFCGVPFTWQCTDPPITPGCPATVPNDGTACSAATLECVYGDPCSPAGAIVDCTNGLWKWNTMIVCGG
jgi:hypothetical protein